MENSKFGHDDHIRDDFCFIPMLVTDIIFPIIRSEAKNAPSGSLPDEAFCYVDETVYFPQDFPHTVEKVVGNSDLYGRKSSIPLFHQVFNSKYKGFHEETNMVFHNFVKRSSLELSTLR